MKIIDYLKKEKIPSYRIDQFKQAYYKELVQSFNEIKVFPKTLRKKLEQTFNFSSLELVKMRTNTAKTGKNKLPLQKTRLKNSNSPHQKPQKNLTQHINSKKSSSHSSGLQNTNSKTQKALLQTKDGNLIETVLIQEKDRNTVCLSTQIGCACNCTFCATGKIGFTRNLTTREIVDQVLFWGRQLKGNNTHISNSSENDSNRNKYNDNNHSSHGNSNNDQKNNTDIHSNLDKKNDNKNDPQITNIVYMGMGEPLLNYENVMNSIKQLTNPNLFAIGQRKITLSTIGILPTLKKLLTHKHQFKIALSLHAPTQKLREKLMPATKENPLHKVLPLLQEYSERTRKRISYEYLMLQGINDKAEHAQQLIELFKGYEYLTFINLIAYNPIDGDGDDRSRWGDDHNDADSNRSIDGSDSILNLENNLKSTTKSKIFKFAKILRNNNLQCYIRFSKGTEIDGACGQLAVSEKKKSIFSINAKPTL